MFAAILVVFLGRDGLGKAMPLLLLAAHGPINHLATSWLNKLGEASGTIYAYHTPFVLQPLVIGSTFLPARWILPGLLASVVVTMLLCTWLHHRLRDTKLRSVLF